MRSPAPRLLLVDDNRDYVETMALLLTGCGCHVASAVDGQRGFELARRIRPDAMLVDLALPGLNGYELLCAVRADPTLHSVYVAAVSGWGGNDEASRSLRAGFDAHFMKPCDHRHLLAAVNDALARRPLATLGAAR